MWVKRQKNQNLKQLNQLTQPPPPKSQPNNSPAPKPATKLTTEETEKAELAKKQKLERAAKLKIEETERKNLLTETNRFIDDQLDADTETTSMQSFIDRLQNTITKRQTQLTNPSNLFPNRNEYRDQTQELVLAQNKLKAYLTIKERVENQKQDSETKTQTTVTAKTEATDRLATSLREYEDKVTTFRETIKQSSSNLFAQKKTETETAKDNYLEAQKNALNALTLIQGIRQQLGQALTDAEKKLQTLDSKQNKYEWTMQQTLITSIKAEIAKVPTDQEIKTSQTDSEDSFKDVKTEHDTLLDIVTRYQIISEIQRYLQGASSKLTTLNNRLWIDTQVYDVSEFRNDGTPVSSSDIVDIQWKQGDSSTSIVNTKDNNNQLLNQFLAVSPSQLRSQITLKLDDSFLRSEKLKENHALLKQIDLNIRHWKTMWHPVLLNGKKYRFGWRTSDRLVWVRHCPTDPCLNVAAQVFKYTPTFLQITQKQWFALSSAEREILREKTIVPDISTKLALQILKKGIPEYKRKQRRDQAWTFLQPHLKRLKNWSHAYPKDFTDASSLPVLVFVKKISGTTITIRYQTFDSGGRSLEKQWDFGNLFDGEKISRDEQTLEKYLELNDFTEDQLQAFIQSTKP